MTYLLRTVPDALWTRCRARAQAAGLSMRAVLIVLLTAYADGWWPGQRE